MSFDLGESIAPTSTLYAHLSDLAKTKSATAEYTVVCNHMSIINRQMKDYKEVRTITHLRLNNCEYVFNTLLR